MTTNICIYFQVHQPDRLRKYSYFDIGHSHNYEDEKVNREIFLKIVNKCYLPACSLLLRLIEQYQGVFKVAFSLSGVFVEQCQRFSSEALDLFKKLAATGCVEFLNETYYHSLSFLFSPAEFTEQVLLHKKMIEQEFGYVATTFRNTELIYNNDVAKFAESLGYRTILAEGTEKILGWRSPGFVYRPHGCQQIKLLLRDYRLTDDVAFRFSDRSWSEYPLLAEKYAYWLHSLHGKTETINLFMDFETFGEHQWHDTGIFEFLEKLPEYVLKHPEYCFATPAEISQRLDPIAELDVPYPVSWADMERDLTAWYGNDLQRDALHVVYALERDVKALNDPQLLHVWRLLQTSDHFYYMCIKYASDGDVHKYFNPYNSPYDAYINYQNILVDFSQEIARKKEEMSVVAASNGITSLATSEQQLQVQSSQRCCWFANILKQLKKLFFEC